MEIFINTNLNSDDVEINKIKQKNKDFVSYMFHLPYYQIVHNNETDLLSFINCFFKGIEQLFEKVCSICVENIENCKQEILTIALNNDDYIYKNNEDDLFLDSLNNIQ